MAQLEGYYFSAALSCTFLVSCLLFSAFSRALREPYMDEIFHLPQAQRYCEGHFSLSQWDPMITTLPGLYLVSVGVVKPASWIFGWSEHVVCSIGMLRFVNLLFSVGNFYLLYLLFRKVQPRNQAASRNVIAQKLTEAWKTELQKKENRLPPIKGPFAEFRKILQFLLAYSMSFKNLNSFVN
ncbi:glucosyltransferase [Saguinus oedipus]|uniref:Dol-P-Glc:Glc(2)Man(9)GlcNAc(2)-PP-Dol alpha-1,2-glucosyltransferase n=1 Tax=Saguinus oedipus TaxID=9490 RepID=A0ABQ9UX94_SAGOE|nr:glucosyltransferase [Saguinus oedipus]